MYNYLYSNKGADKMNGQNPNLNSGTNNGLNGETLGSTTLGTAQSVPNPTQIPNIPTGGVPNPAVTPNIPASEVPNPTVMPNAPQPQSTPAVESLDASVQSPVAQPIPGTENLTGNTVGANNSFTPSGNVNGFTSANKMESIGAMPPQNNEPKKKGMNKILFVLLIIILICAVAFGVYYFLNISNNTVKLTTKTVSVGIGETLPDDIKEYVTVTKGNINICSINTKNVDTQTSGEYDVTITCGKKTYTSKVVVSDKTGPVATLNMLFKTVNSTVTSEDFIKTCNDPSNCKTSFASDDAVNEYLKTAGGPYSVAIIAEDDLGNKSEYTATLYVTSEEIFLYANFASSEESLTDYKAKKTVTDVLAFSKGLTFLNVARRDVKYTFENETEYFEIVTEKKDTMTFDGITGIATYDDKNLSFTISTDLSLDTLNSENNGSFPTSYQDIQAIYKNKGYTPTFVKEYPQTESED